MTIKLFIHHERELYLQLYTSWLHISV